VVDKRVFLIHLFELVIEALSRNAASQLTTPKALEKLLEEVSADILKRPRKYFLPAIHDLSVVDVLQEMKKPPALRIPKEYPCPWMDTVVVEEKIFDAERVVIVTKDLTIHTEDFSASKLLSSFLDMELDLGRLSLYNVRENLATPISLPGEEVDMSPKEGGPQQGVETTNLQALKEFEDSVEEKLKSSEDTSDVFNKAVSLAVSLTHDICKASQKGVAPEEIKEALQQKAQALPKKGDIFSLQPKQEKDLQPPDLSEIPLYQGHRGRRKQGSPPEVRPLDFLKTHYGQYLAAFGAEENIVFQDQIRAHDPKLIQGVKNQLRGEGKGRKVSDFVKTRSARVDRELENVSVADIKKEPRLASTLYSRETRAAKAKAAASARSVTRK
jgi:hypothetical protein